MQFASVLKSAQAGDQSAIKAIIDEFSNEVRAVCFSFDVDGIAEISRTDLVQDAWVKIWVQINRFRICGDEETSKKMFRGWIRRIARNEMINTLEKNGAKKRRPTTPIRQLSTSLNPTRSSKSPSKLLMKLEEIDQLNSAIGRLSTESQTLIRSCFFDGKTMKQISIDLDMSYEQVRHRLAAAISNLRNLMP